MVPINQCNLELLHEKLPLIPNLQDINLSGLAVWFKQGWISLYQVQFGLRLGSKFFFNNFSSSDKDKTEIEASKKSMSM